MINIPFIDKLPYSYDAEYIEYMKEYNIIGIYYNLDDSLIHPYIEIILNDDLGFHDIVYEPHIINQRNLKSNIIKGEILLQDSHMSSRYQGYQCTGDTVYLYYRCVSNQENNTNNVTIYDIINVKHYFNIPIQNSVIHYFNDIYTKLYINNIYSKIHITFIPEVKYTYINNDIKLITYIRNHSSIYYMNPISPILDLTIYSKSLDTDILVRNIVFGSDNIITDRQL
jgi:hypothetical protein